MKIHTTLLYCSQMDGWWENQWSFSTYRMAKSSLEKHLLLYGFSSLENFGAWSLRRLSLNAAPQYKQIPARNCWPGKVSATLQTLSKLLMYYFDGVGCPINAFKVRCPFNWVCQDYNWLLPWENKSCKLQRCIYFFLSVLLWWKLYSCSIYLKAWQVGPHLRPSA